jgi:hypothetical protein
MPLYPSKMPRTRERALTPYSFIVFNLDSHLNPLRSWERVIKDFEIETIALHFLVIPS